MFGTKVVPSKGGLTLKHQKNVRIGARIGEANVDGTYVTALIE